jgi:DNA gyrase subunit B
MPELVRRGHIYVAQPPLYRLTKGKELRFAISEAQKRAGMSEMGLGQTVLVIDKAIGGSRSFQGKDLQRLQEVLGQVLEFRKRMPAEAVVPFGDYLAQATQPEMELPKFFFVHGGQKRFVDTQSQLDAELERLSQGGKLKIYEGPESSCTRKEADVEVYALHVGEEISPLLRQIWAMKLGPELFLGGSEPLGRVLPAGRQEEALPWASLAQASELVETSCAKSVVVTRFKGLGEMNSPDLRETAMDPAKRTLYRVTINDAVEADRMFTVLMGPEVEPRREFIERHALEVTNLDV